MFKDERDRSRKLTRAQQIARAIAVVAVLVIPVSAIAQDEFGLGATGVQPGRSYMSELPFEQIDLYSGKRTLSFTDVVFPGHAGMDLRWQRTYGLDAQVSSVPTWSGWSFGLAGVPMQIFDDCFTSSCLSGPEPPRPTFLAVDGMEKGYYPVGATTYAQVVTSRFWKYNRVTGVLEFPNGWVGHYSPMYNPATGDVWDVGSLLTGLEDTFGNAIQLGYILPDGGPPRVATITQFLPGQTRTLWLQYNNAFLTGVTFQGRTWTYVYAQTGLTEVNPPAGPGWRFEYQNNTVCA
jgi:hypothetical protein